jgi:hypothetical protein
MDEVRGGFLITGWSCENLKAAGGSVAQEKVGTIPKEGGRKKRKSKRSRKGEKRREEKERDARRGWLEVGENEDARARGEVRLGEVRLNEVLCKRESARRAGKNWQRLSFVPSCQYRDTPPDIPPLLTDS